VATHFSDYSVWSIVRPLQEVVVDAL